MSVRRFTVRRLMVAVAIAGLLLAGFNEFKRLQRQAGFYRDRAREHAEMVETLQSFVGKPGMSRLDCSPGPGLRSVPYPIQAVIEHESRLKRKYERAARYPWLSVEPDPALPE